MQNFLTEESRVWRLKICIIFVDFEKDFDFMNGDSLKNILIHYGVRKKIVTIIIPMNESSECCVKTQKGHTRVFQILSWLKFLPY